MLLLCCVRKHSYLLFVMHFSSVTFRGVQLCLKGTGSLFFRPLLIRLNSSDSRPLYDGHIPTSLFQKLGLTFGGGLIVLACPQRDDLIAAVGESSGYCALKYMKRKLEQSQSGNLILAERPRINTSTVDFKYLSELPEETLGRHYSDWLKRNKADPDARKPVHFVDDADLAYVMQRYRETHDLIHTILGMETNWLGEVTVKIVEGLQFGLPMCVLGGLLGPVRFYWYPKHRRKFFTSYLPWAIQTGMNANFLLSVYYERRWEESLSDVRKSLNIQPLGTLS